jgi:signal transduction histidine kinase
MNVILEEKSLNLFRFSLLNMLLKIIFIFSFIVAIIASFDFLPLDANYEKILFFYSFVNLVAYYLLKKDVKYYFLAVNLAIFSALLTFTVMSITILHDEFRFVWFFLISFSSFILAGRKYGFIITFLIVVIVSALYLFTNIEFSLYAFLTFMSALFIFTLFANFFIEKTENDSMLLQEKVKEEVAKQEVQEQMLLQQYRMANMGEMIDAIAHQWRQPLMQSNMMLLNMSESLDDEVYLEKKINDLTRLNKHMSQTIDDFRNLLKDGKIKSTFSVTRAIDEVLVLLKNNLREVVLTYEVKEVKILSYKNEFMQVLITLISNALEALEDIEDKHLSICIKEENNMLYVEVSDNAGGVEPQIMKKIFDPYFTTKEQSGGTGLGLYIAKIIVEQNLNGSIEAENIKEGAKFTVILPLEE